MLIITQIQHPLQKTADNKKQSRTAEPAAKKKKTKINKRGVF